MIDGIKIMSLMVHNRDILYNPNLDFLGKFSFTNGDVKEVQPVEAYCKGLVFSLTPTPAHQLRCGLEGSLHRYFHGSHNGYDFSIVELLYVLNDLAINFKIDLFESVLNNLEFGVYAAPLEPDHFFE